jgi:hypothetical protein
MMKQTLKSLFAFTVLLSAVQAVAVTPTFIPRSQSVNVAREMVGWQNLINLCDMEECYGAFAITPEYTQSFRNGRLAECLLGVGSNCESDCNGASIKVSGSQVANRGATDWLGDYFGLPTDFQSTLSFSPRVRNFLVDFNLFLGLDNLACGLYFKIHAPIVHTRWDLRFRENVIEPGVNNALAGYYNGTGVVRSNLLANASAFFQGNAPVLAEESTSGSCIGNTVFQPLAFSKFAGSNCGCDGLKKTRLSDIEAALGWNFWCDEDYLVGVSIRASAPTGNAPKGEFFFEPIIGDGKHWKLGGGLNAQAIFWRSECESNSFGVFLEAHVQHLFKHCQKRSFDLCDKPNSRYMLAEQLGTTRLSEFLVAPSDAGVEFQNVFAPVANLTASNVDVKINVEGDVALKFAYMTDCWEFDLGYNFWGRSCEKLCRKSCGTDPLADGKTWALKGDAFVVGFTGVSYPADTDGCVRLAASESLATINAGTNGFNGPYSFPVSLTRASSNPGIDTPVHAVSNAGEVFDNTTLAVQTRSSVDPVFLSDASIDLAGVKGISHKLFANWSYEWVDCECVTPFLGIGGEVEFAQRNCGSCSSGCSSNNCGVTPSVTTTTNCQSACQSTCASSCNTGCNSCSRCALSQWGVWIKGGVAFN